MSKAYLVRRTSIHLIKITGDACELDVIQDMLDSGTQFFDDAIRYCADRSIELKYRVEVVDLRRDLFALEHDIAVDAHRVYLNDLSNVRDLGAIYRYRESV